MQVYRADFTLLLPRHGSNVESANPELAVLAGYTTEQYFFAESIKKRYFSQKLSFCCPGWNRTNAI